MYDKVIGQTFRAVAKPLTNDFFYGKIKESKHY